MSLERQKWTDAIEVERSYLAWFVPAAVLIIAGFVFRSINFKFSIGFLIISAITLSALLSDMIFQPINSQRIHNLKIVIVILLGFLFMVIIENIFRLDELDQTDLPIS